MSHARFLFGVAVGCVLFFLSIYNAKAQTRLSGTVKSEDGAPIPGANVLLLNASDSIMIKGVVADLKGNFQFNAVRSGKFFMVTSMVGYEKIYSSSFEVGHEPVYVAPTILKVSSTELQSVTVAAEKPMFEQHIDKLVVNVENSITSAGGTILEVLQRSPGITYNRQANSLSLVGKQGVLVMINGKIQRVPMDALVQQLAGMNANTVEKIEIISNPSAKYDAEGDAGIINIVMKKNPEIGTNGSYTLSMGYGWYEKPSGSFRINYRKPKSNFFADYSVNYNHLWQQFTFKGQNPLEEKLINTVSNRYCEILVQRATMGAEFNVTPKLIIGAVVSAFDNKFTMDAINDSKTNIGGSPSSTILLNDVEMNQWKHVMGNVNLQQTLVNGSFSVDMDYLYYRDNNPHQYRNDYWYMDNDSTSSENIRIDKITPITIGVIKADLEKTIGKIKLETGVKGTMSELSNKVTVQEKVQDEEWSINANFTQDYEMTDNVLAAYANVLLNLNDNTKLQVGLRAESTDMEILTPSNEKVFDLQFVSVFPTAFVTRQISKDQALNFSYGKRITRPSYKDIAPFVVFLDPFTFFSGNPKLKPTITHNISTTYTYKQVITSVKYSLDNDYIARYQARFDPVDKKTYYFSSNLDKVQTLSLSLSAPVDVTRWWELQTNVLGLYQQIETEYFGSAVSMELMSSQLNSTSTFEVGNGYSSQVSVAYWSPSLFGIQRVSSFSEVSLGVQKKFANNTGSIRLNVSDIFWTNMYRFQIDNEALNLHQQGRLRFEPRVIRISFTKNFGSNSIKSGRRTTGSETEQGRVN
jgi:hypothetical protein